MEERSKHAEGSRSSLHVAPGEETGKLPNNLLGLVRPSFLSRAENLQSSVAEPWKAHKSILIQGALLPSWGNCRPNRTTAKVLCDPDRPNASRSQKRRYQKLLRRLYIVLFQFKYLLLQ